MGPNAFDFWLGDWDCVTEAGPATNRITREYEGRVIVEKFSVLSPKSWSGMSVSTYSEHSGWRQTWVDQDANHWNFIGTEVDGNPSFATVGRVDADQTFKRMVFSEIEDDSLFWLWETSEDGETWSKRMTAAYTRKRA